MLSRERDLPRILGGGRRTHGHGRTVSQGIVRGADLRSDLGHGVLLAKELPDALRRLLERNNALDNFGSDKDQNPCLEVIGIDESSIGQCGDQESARHIEAGVDQPR